MCQGRKTHTKNSHITFGEVATGSLGYNMKVSIQEALDQDLRQSA